MPDRDAPKIRPATVYDVAAARHIREALPLHLSRDYERNIGHPNCVNLVAEVDAQVIGFVSALVGPADRYGDAIWKRLLPYIAFVGVQESYRNQGICRRLVDRAIHDVKRFDLSIDLVYLQCEEPLVDLYRKLNFVLLEPHEVRVLCGLASKTPVMRRIV